MKDLDFSDVLDTPEKLKQAAFDVQGMRAHPGWHIIERILNANIKLIEEKILGDEELSTAEEKELKSDRFRFLWFRDLPGQIANSGLNETFGRIDNPDPYDTDNTTA